MLDGLMGGTLVGAPQEKTGPSGRPFVQCRVRVPTPEGDALFALVTAFDGPVRRALLAMTAGDPVSLAGAIKLGVWMPTEGEPKPSLTMIASAVNSPYSVKKKRDAMQAGQAPRVAMQRARAPAPRQGPPSAVEVADDDLEF